MPGRRKEIIGPLGQILGEIVSANIIAETLLPSDLPQSKIKLEIDDGKVIEVVVFGHDVKR